MKNVNKLLMIEQMDKKIAKFAQIERDIVPQHGWIKAIRTSMNISLIQLSRILKKSAPTVKELEEREAEKNITLKKLTEVAQALNMRLVYGFVPNDGSLEKIIEKRARKIATEIVLRTSHTMKLENQENTEERINKAIRDRTEIIKQQLPKYLWD